MPGFGQALGVADRAMLQALIRGVNQPIRADGTAPVQQLLQCVEREGWARRGRHAPAYDPGRTHRSRR